MSGNEESRDQVQQWHKVWISREGDKTQLQNPIWAFSPCETQADIHSFHSNATFDFLFFFCAENIPFLCGRAGGGETCLCLTSMAERERCKVDQCTRGDCVIVHFISYFTFIFNRFVTFVNSCFYQEMFWSTPWRLFTSTVSTYAGMFSQMRSYTWISFFCSLPWFHGCFDMWKTGSADSVLRFQLEFTKSVRQLGASSNYQQLSGVQMLVVAMMPDVCEKMGLLIGAFDWKQGRV